jgi:hypothetical protein
MFPINVKFFLPFKPEHIERACIQSSEFNIKLSNLSDNILREEQYATVESLKNQTPTCNTTKQPDKLFYVLALLPQWNKMFFLGNKISATGQYKLYRKAYGSITELMPKSSVSVRKKLF